MTLFLDMDGVIADFFTLFAEENKASHWKSINCKESALQNIRRTDFFNRIKPFPISNDLVQFAKNVGDWGICSSPLKNDFGNSAYWKRVWLERHDYMPSVEKCIFTRVKHKYAIHPITLQPNILVDDKPENIEDWTNAGGIGVKFQANQDDFASLIKRLNSFLNVISLAS